jgi:hypothetical protein
VLAAAPAEPLLVWSGGGHAAKEAAHGWVTMGCHFPAMSGTDPFIIDQTVSVDVSGRSKPWLQALLATLSETLAAHGGTVGIVREQAPILLNSWPGVDAVIVSTDNTITNPGRSSRHAHTHADIRPRAAIRAATPPHHLGWEQTKPTCCGAARAEDLDGFGWSRSWPSPYSASVSALSTARSARAAWSCGRVTAGTACLRVQGHQRGGGGAPVRLPPGRARQATGLESASSPALPPAHGGTLCQFPSWAEARRARLGQRMWSARRRSARPRPCAGGPARRRTGTPSPGSCCGRRRSGRRHDAHSRAPASTRHPGGGKGVASIANRSRLHRAHACRTCAAWSAGRPASAASRRP